MSTRGRRKRALWPALVLSWMVGSSGLASEAPTPDTVSSARGAALFEGREPLSGTIRGHTSPMPSGVLTCGGCHGRPSPQAGGVSDVPSLDAAGLLTSKARRNGPPSAYNEETFCRLVRTGVDPVYVLVLRSMPVFDVSPEQCASLWLYVSTRTSS